MSFYIDVIVPLPIDIIFTYRINKSEYGFLKKGSKVYLEGQLETRKWQDNSGADRYSTDIVLRPFKSEITLIDNKADSNIINETNTETQINQSSDTNTNLNAEEFDDEIPF